MIPYLLHVAVLTAGIYAFYQLLLRSETFFKLNRWVLLGGLGLAFMLPLIPVPEEWSFREMEASVVIEEQSSSRLKSPLMVMNESPVTHLPKPKIESVKPSASVEKVVPMKNEASTSLIIKQVEKSRWKKISLKQWLAYLYMGGLIIFTLNFIIQFVVLLSKSVRRADIQDGPFRIIELDKDEGPFSFWNTIFLNPSKYDPDTFQQILDHEKIHVAQRHSIDILLAELLLIVQWFNPFAWLYRKAVENNLEFLTDREMLKSGTDRERYQMSLLRVSVPHLPLHLTSNYNQSILKKRILMMNGKKSSLQSVWKYLMILPLLGCSMLFMNAVIPHDMERAENFKEDLELITQDESSELSAAQSTIIAYNKSTEKTTKQLSLAQADDQPNPEATPAMLMDEQRTAADLHLYDLVMQSGYWKGSLSGDQLCILFSSESDEEGQHHWRTDRCFPKSAFSGLTTNGAGQFTLQREAGTLTFEGQFNGDKGEGKFSFKENETFKSYLNGQGIRDLNSNALFFMCLSDVNKDYIVFLQQQNFDKITGDQLQALAIHEVTLTKLKSDLNGYRSMGYPPLKLDQVIALNIHEVDPEYAREMRKEVGEDLSIDQLVAAKIHNVEGGYIREIRAEGFPDVKFDDIVGFAIHDIDVEYIRELKAAGLRDLKAEEITAAAIHDIDAEYITKMKAAGFEDMKFEELVGFAIHDVDPDFINELKAAGLNDLSSEDITAAAIHDIDADYIKKMKAAFGDMKFEELVGFAIHDVDPEYVQELKSAGLQNLSNEDITAAAIHDIDADYIKKMKAAFGDMKFEELVGFAIHDIDPEYVQGLKSAGLKDLSNEDIIAAAIHDIDADYLQEMQAAGFSSMKFEEVVGFAIHDIDPEYIQGLKAAGLDDLSHENITTAAIHDIDADYIKKMKAAFGDMKFEELVGFAIHDIDPEYVQGLKAAGLKNLTNEKIIAAAIHDIDADYLQAIQAAGLGDMEFEEVVGFAIHDIDAGDIKKIQAAGVKDLDNEGIKKLAIHDVDSQFIESYKAIGMSNLTAEELVMLKIHHVKPGFIEEMKAKGHKDKSVEEYIQLKLHNGKSYH